MLNPKFNLMKAKLLVLLLMISLTGFGQSRLSGKVIDDGGLPLPGVNVLVKGTTQGVVTEMNGEYVLTDVADDAILVFSFIGFESQEIARNGRSVIDVKLLPDVKTLEEVVVVGYGTQKKSVATASLSKVDAKDLTGFGVARVDQMLQGQVAGVSFKSVSGQPGSELNIYIRGIGTNGDNRPLIIIDGIVVNDGILQSLNPADIESVQVLKDGASTAIYGSRGANGIIMVTTKKAKAGVATFNYSASYGIQQPWRVPQMLNSSQYVDLIREKYQNGKGTPPAGFPEQGSITSDTDWMDQIFENGSTQSHNISMSKGTDTGSLQASLSYFDQKGVVAPDKSNVKRITGRFNTEQKINDFLSFGQNIFLMRSVNNRIPENSEFGTPIADALVYDPTTPAYVAGQQYGFAQSPFVQKEYINPLSRIYISNITNNTDEVTGNVFFKVRPIKNLTFQSDLGMDYVYYTGKGFTPSHAFTPAFFNTINDIYQYETKANRWQWENFATYSKSIEKHNADITIGTTLQVRNNGTGFSANSSGVPVDVQFNPNFWYIGGTPDSLQRSNSFGAERQALKSFFGRVNYNYDEKYLASVTFRRDGSTQFGSNNRYGNFPSASVGWVASKESFFPQIAVNFVKLRASYGINGNDRIPALAYAAIIERTGAYPFGKPNNQTIFNGQSSSFSPNPNVKWEQSKQLDIGLEVGVWNDQLTLELDYYQKTTSGLLMSATVADYTGTNAPTANVGEVVNKGLEFEVTYRRTFGAFNVQLGATGATLKNNVTKVNADGYQDGYTWPIRNTVITRMELNRPVGFFRGYKTEGVFKSQNDVFAHINAAGDPLQPKAVPGDLKFVDTNKDGVIDSKDIVQIGKPWADFTFGFNASVAYRGFDLKMLFAGSVGNDVYRSYERQDVPNNNYQTEWLDRWSESNPNGNYPRVTTNDTNNNTRPSDFYVEDASYVRLRNLQLGYNLPTSILQKLKMSALRIYISGDNLLTVTGYSGFDPEVGTAFNSNNGTFNILDTGIDKGFYPQMKTFAAGINVSL
jgi:TonB-linked SusC/RagA family outer membrane protein